MCINYQNNGVFTTYIAPDIMVALDVESKKLRVYNMKSNLKLLSEDLETSLTLSEFGEKINKLKSQF